MVSLLQNGNEFFPAIESAIDRAKFEVYLESYIFKNDRIGQRIAEALIRATCRGVKVFLLIDGYGSKDLPQDLLVRMRTNGVNTLVFRPNISPWTLKRKRLRRMHRKVVVVDREIAFVGGINIVDDTQSASESTSRYDCAVTVEGPLVDVIRQSARHLWMMVAWRSLRKNLRETVELPASRFSGGKMSAAFVMRDNVRHRRDIEKSYLRAISEAQSEIILAHAYFLPGHDFRHALIEAARRKVRVVLLLQGKVEYFVQHHATRALYGNLLDEGIEIYEYRKNFLHAKVAVIDGHWATVGSSNIDPFSLLLSREANVVVDDKGFASTLEQSLKQTIENEGFQILKDSWKRQGFALRFVSWLCYGVLRLMMNVSGYARSYDDEST